MEAIDFGAVVAHLFVFGAGLFAGVRVVDDVLAWRSHRRPAGD